MFHVKHFKKCFYCKENYKLNKEAADDDTNIKAENVIFIIKT